MKKINNMKFEVAYSAGRGDFGLFECEGSRIVAVFAEDGIGYWDYNPETKNVEFVSHDSDESWLQWSIYYRSRSGKSGEAILHIPNGCRFLGDVSLAEYAGCGDMPQYADDVTVVRKNITIKDDVIETSIDAISLLVLLSGFPAVKSVQAKEMQILWKDPEYYIHNQRNSYHEYKLVYSLNRKGTEKTAQELGGFILPPDVYMADGAHDIHFQKPVEEARQVKLIAEYMGVDISSFPFIYDNIMIIGSGHENKWYIRRYTKKFSKGIWVQSPMSDISTFVVERVFIDHDDKYAVYISKDGRYRKYSKEINCHIYTYEMESKTGWLFQSEDDLFKEAYASMLKNANDDLAAYQKRKKRMEENKEAIEASTKDERAFIEANPEMILDAEFNFSAKIFIWEYFQKRKISFKEIADHEFFIEMLGDVSFLRIIKDMMGA